MNWRAAVKASVALVVCAGGLAGCLVDDSGGSRGQSSGPTATVPDSGSPIRRESAAKTLKDAEPTAPASADDGNTTVRERENQ